MRHLPAGQLGSLVIYKSGKIKMKIGDILLDVRRHARHTHMQTPCITRAGGDSDVSCWVFVCSSVRPSGE
jgi:hypothetical protein